MRKVTSHTLGLESSIKPLQGNVREAEVEEFDIQKMGKSKNWRLRKAFAEASYILKKKA